MLELLPIPTPFTFSTFDDGQIHSSKAEVACRRAEDNEFNLIALMSYW
jgi:hypothetical protein